jgi:bla regulator protein blaR1
MRRVLAPALFAGLFSGIILMPILDAQTPAPPDPLPQFEVAAVKENKSGTNMIRFGVQPGGRFTAENVPLRQLLVFAFQVQPFQIENVPSWANSVRYDITAKAEGDIPPAQPGQVGSIQYMMRALLRDRFALVYHNETREMPIFNLIVAKPDGSLGPKLTKSTTDCAAMFAARRGGGPGGPGGAGGPGGRGDGPPPMPAFGEKMVCGFRVGPGSLSGGSVPIGQLATFLSQNLQRSVVDKTGLAGNYDFDVTFTPDQIPQLPGGGAPPGAPPLPPIDPNGPSLTTALQEQLGLKLDSTRGPATLFVIDKVSQPTPD